MRFATFFLLSPLLVPAPRWLGAPQQPAEATGQVVGYYQSEHAPVSELQAALIGIYRGRSAPNLLEFGRTLVVSGESSAVTDALELAKRLDREWNAEGSSQRPLTTIEYRARYVPVENLLTALQSYSRKVQFQDSLGTWVQVPNISVLRERGVVVIRDEQQTTTEVESLLQRIDVAQPQLRIACYLLAGKPEATDDPRVPQALAADLSRLVPYAGFELVSYGLFQSDAGSVVDMEESLEDGGRFELKLVPKPTGLASDALDLESCRFQLAQTDEGGNVKQKQFSTSTRLRLGEFTVLGALGGDPVFVVLRAERIGD